MLIDRQDLLYAIRSARRSPLLTLIVVLALAVGIGLNAGVFTLLNFLFIQPPVKKAPASFVQMFPRYEGWFTGAGEASSFTAGDYDAIRTQSRTLSDVAAWNPARITLNDVNQRSTSVLATCNYFKVYGMDRPLMGRFFFPDECKPGTSVQVVVLSEHFWKYFFAADPKIVGKIIHINRQPFSVIGVAPDSAANLIPGGGLWMPYTLQPLFDHGNNVFQNADWPWLSVTARLQPGYSRSDAKAELQTILRQRDRLYLERKISTLDRKTSLILTNGSFIENPHAQSKLTLLMVLIMGPLLLVLLLACTNVTMLFLSRSVVRRGETAIRLALGSGRVRLLRMMTIESLFTAALAGAISIFLAYRIPIALMSFIDPTEAKFIPAVQPDWTVFAYLAVLVLLAAVLSALAPVRESFNLDLVTALKGREGSATFRTRTTSILIVAQLAMSFVLVSAAVLFGRMPLQIANIDPGFETRHLLSVPVDINMPPYTNDSALTFFHSLEARIQQVPGIQSLAYASVTPFRPPPPGEVRLPNQAKGQGKPATVDDVSPDFFTTFGISFIHGRTFQGSDVSAASSAKIAVVSDAFAKSIFGNADPVGKVIVTPDDKRLVIVGVARDTRSEQFGDLDGPRLYTLRDPQSLNGQLFVRFTGDVAPIKINIEAILKNLDSAQVSSPVTIQEDLDDTAAQLRTLAEIIVFMAGIAVLLAVTGVYGVLTFATNQRTREFGIQMVLGATRQTIFRSVLVRGLQQVAVGLILGVSLTVPAMWMLKNFLGKSNFHIHLLDFSVYGVSALTLLIVSLTAMYLPALRATQVDPIQALRNE